MSDLIVVSNRGPTSLFRGADGVLRSRHAAGGLAPSLVSALSATNGTWIAAATTDIERQAVTEGLPEHEGSFSLRLVSIAPNIVSGALRVIANGVLWFSYHDLFDRVYRPTFTREFHQAWDHYRTYNQQMAEAVAEEASEGATVVVNDYHLSLIGTDLARLRPDLKTVHFSHTPFCTANELATLPSAIAKELIQGLSSFGTLGFHTSRWASRFQSCADSRLVDPPPLFVQPLGVDAPSLLEVASSEKCIEKRNELIEKLAGRKLIFRSDRLELSKNIVRGFLAYEEMLLTHPELLGTVVFVARVYPSREDLPEYLAYRSTVEHTVERINARFASDGPPVIELVIEDDFAASVAASTLYDVLFVNPVRDGMNLVAKEGPTVNTNNGVLALSIEAGAYEEIGEAAVRIEPFDVAGTADAMFLALTMDDDERAKRAAVIKEIAGAAPPDVWFRRVVENAKIRTFES